MHDVHGMSITLPPGHAEILRNTRTGGKNLLVQHTLWWYATVHWYGEGNMRVLLVEDDLTAAHGVSLMLKSAGAVVEHAETGEEAIELTRHYEYDIVLLDVILPDVEGY